MATVSVIIPTYNRADLLPQAIDSVLAQTLPAWEIIVADDGSTDNTAQVVAQYGQRVRYVPLPHRAQIGATRNGGLQIATGEFIAFLDSDDLFLPDKLVIQVPILAAQSDIALVYSDGYYFTDDIRRSTGHVMDGLPSPSGNVLPQLLIGNFLAPPTVLVRRRHLDQVGLFREDPDLFGVEDYSLWTRLAAQFPFAFVPGEVAAIRRHPSSMSRNTVTLRKRVLRVLDEFKSLHPSLFRTYNTQFHEGYALSCGAVAAAAVKDGRGLTGLTYTLRGMGHLLHLPGLGIPALRAWRQRSRMRGDSAR
jgi:glycosyltransferase involved in cell wall biosynthesis